MRMRKRIDVGVALLVVLFLNDKGAHAAALKPEAASTWNRYIALAEERIDHEQRDVTHFLWVDNLAVEQRAPVQAQLRNGEVVIQRVDPPENEAKPPGALIHHWIGSAFIPRATLQQALALVQDYDNHYKIYTPEVERSKLISHENDDFRIFIRYRKKKIITVVLNSFHDVHYTNIDATHAHCRTHTTKVTEVADPGTPAEHERAPDQQNGYLWALNTYWRFEERDGGVYLQCEAITLTRSVPLGLRWLIEPYITSFPRESLTETMNDTRKALIAHAGQ